MSEEKGGIVIAPIRQLIARFEPMEWAFERSRADAIAAHWDTFSTDKPHVFNGRVLLQHRWTLEDGIYRGFYLEAQYAAFIAWRDFGFPGAPMRNGFSMAALRARDGAYLLGVMGQGTANAGKIYFAAGTPDRGDLRPDGVVDLAGSVVRELGEETGLQPDEVTFSSDWHVVIDGPRAAFMRPTFIDLPAKEARQLILSRLPSLAEEELSDIHIVRGPGDLDPARMPAFQIAYLEAMFRDQG